MNPGDVIAGKYRLERKLGEGGVGVVWAAQQLGLGRTVAIKLLQADAFDDQRDRFQREAQAVGRLEHDNCVKLFDFGRTESGAPYLVFEHLEGQSLDALRGVRLEWRRAVEIVYQVAEALRYAHAHGVVHRDLKPANIFQAQRHGREVIKVLDFGLAKLGGPVDVDLTSSGAVFGTPHYMSPEQLRGSRDVTPAADLYSLGVVLFELLEGRPPFDADSPIELAHQHLTTAAPRVTRADCPEPLKDIIEHLLVKEPAHRLGDAGELCAALAALESPAPTTTEPLPTHWLAMTGASMLLLSIIAIVVMVASHEKEPPPRAAEPRRRVLPPASPRQPPPPPLVAIADVGAEADATTMSIDAGHPSGCGRQTDQRGLIDVTGRADYTLMIPSDYDPDAPTAVVMFLPEAAQLPLEDTRLADLADEHGFLLLFPVKLAGDRRRATLGLWSYERDFDNVTAALHDVRTKYCVDERRIFAVGHATGGEIVETLGCSALGIDAIATTATRTVDFDAVCPLPYLHLGAKHDRYNPVDGGVGCSGAQKVSFAEQESKWRKLNGCTADRAQISEDRGSVCWDWAGCEHPFRSCLIAGGHNWPGTGERVLGNLQELLKGEHDCDGPPTTFPIERAIWDFFESIE